MQPMIDETSAINDQHSPSLSSAEYLHSTYLPLDLVEENILCRLPVKFLLQIRCVCKSWNSLISSPKFAKKHLDMSTRLRLHFLSSMDPIPLRGNMITSCPLQCVFTTVSTKLEYPHNKVEYVIVGSCNGILCVAHQCTSFIQLWNPSIRKFKELPPFEEPPYPSSHHTYGFGYDFVTDSYKVVVISFYDLPNDHGNYKNEVKVNTLGTNFWKNMQEFPFGMPDSSTLGKFVSGTINWLASKHWHHSPCFIVSLDLGKESFQKVLLPKSYGEIDESFNFLSVLRDCLCLIYVHEVWIMKEYGNEDSWTKLFRVSYTRDPSKQFYLTKVVYMFEDGQVLLQSAGDWYSRLILYDPRICTFKFVKFQNKCVYDPTSVYGPEVCIESLISPCF